MGWIVILFPMPVMADLPPPPAELGIPETMRLRLELVLNGAATGDVVPVDVEGGTYHVDARDLRNAGLPIDPVATGKLAIDSLPNVEAVYDESGQRLLLTVPGDWLPHQAVGRIQSTARIRPESSLGALLNYDLYAVRSGGGRGYASLWNEARIFGQFGVIRATSTLRQPLSGPSKTRFTRYDTSWTYVDEERIRTYEAGDLVTRTLSWASPVRLGGVQVSRDFAVRPDIVTYPTPSFSGTAAVPTAIELFINGHQTADEMLQPGPFTLNDVPYVSGGGEAVIVTTDAQGRRTSTSVPFYVANTLLRPGLSDFAFSVGKLRRHYGLRNFSYGATVASGAWRQGVTEWLTVEAQAQAAPSLTVGGVGGLIRVGNLGVIDVSATGSRHNGETGTQLTAGYQYSDRHINVMVRHVRRDPDFVDLGGYGFSQFRLPRRETQASGSLVLDGGVGTLGANYIDTQWRDERFRLAGVSFAQPISQRGNLLFFANRDLDRGTTTAMIQLTVSLGRQGAASAALERNASGRFRKQLNYSRSVPTDGGIGWNAAVAHGGRYKTQYQGDVTWRTPSVQLQGGAYGGGGNDAFWGSVSGSLVVMGGGTFAANRINDAFVVVSTDGVSGVPVRQENQRVGVTDSDGLLLLPWVNAYYGSKFEIDPLDLPANMVTPVVEQRAAVKLGSGRVVHFPIRQTRPVTLILHDRQGRPLPAGSPVVTDTGIVAYVGWDGIVYLEDVGAANRVKVELGDRNRCTVEFSLPTGKSQKAHIGPLTCR